MKIKDRKPLGFFTRKLDFAKVAEETEKFEDGGFVLTRPQLEAVRQGIFAANEKWLVRDIYEFKLDSIEERFEVDTFSNGGQAVKGFIDLSGTLNGTQAPFGAYAGGGFVLDWKTSDRPLTTDWKNRQVDSWQWPLYAAIKGAALAIYRGYSWGDGDTREIIIKVPDWNLNSVREQYGSVLELRRTLVMGGYEVWPQHKPTACNMYGEECPFYSDCYDYSMPRQKMDVRPLSYSRVSDFMLCPEKARRMELLEIDNARGYQTKRTAMGQAFHRGVAEVYRQVKELGEDIFK